MIKLELAHDYAMKHIQEGWDINYDVLVVDAWAYADAMQAEVDKRKPSGLPEALKEEWQPDWSQAPDWANWWAMDADSDCYWFENKPEIMSVTWLPFNASEVGDAPTFNYQGNWRNSLRKRPQ